ncbi:hypothetical protein DFJ74DRAFT_69501 [Hyaloraphidium curvatum]|nr:hypothetical protein DFJ74DRAFT_69501 [Hyaloraphidium curvatum]
MPGPLFPGAVCGAGRWTSRRRRVRGTSSASSACLAAGGAACISQGTYSLGLRGWIRPWRPLYRVRCRPPPRRWLSAPTLSAGRGLARKSGVASNIHEVSVFMHKRTPTSTFRSAANEANDGLTRDPNGRRARTGTGAWVSDVDKIPEQLSRNWSNFPDDTIVAAIDYGFNNVVTCGRTTLGQIRAAENIYVYDKNPLDNPLLYEVEEIVACEVDGVVVDLDGRPLLELFGGTVVTDDPMPLVDDDHVMRVDGEDIMMEPADRTWLASDVAEKLVDGRRVYVRKVNKGDVRLDFFTVTAANVKKHTGAARREKETAERFEQVFGCKDPFASLGSPRTCDVPRLKAYLCTLFDRADRVWTVTLGSDIVRLRFLSYIDSQRFYGNTLAAWVVGGKENLSKSVWLFSGAAGLVFKNRKGNQPVSVRKCRKSLSFALNPGIGQFNLDTGGEYSSQVHAAAHLWEHPERSLVCINHAEESPDKRPRGLQRCEGTRYSCGAHVARDKNSAKDVMGIGLSNVVFGTRPTVFTYEFWRKR